MQYCFVLSIVKLLGQHFAIRLPSEMRLLQKERKTCAIYDLLAIDEEHSHWDFSIYDLSMSAMYRPMNKEINSSWAPATFNTYESRTYDPMKGMSMIKNKGFNQYLLEQTMLVKWLQSGLCCTEREKTCTKNEDIIIVPSLTLHVMVQNGFEWNNVWCNSSCHKAMKHEELGHNYWQLLRAKYFKDGRKPFIVLHLGYTLDTPLTIEILRSLSKEPPEFVTRVIIGCVEPSIRKADKASMLTLPHLVALPYPVGISSAASFTLGDGQNYDPNRQRPIAISFEGNLDQGKRDGGNHVRPELVRQFQKYGGVSSFATHVVCEYAPTNNGDENKNKDTCGLKVEGEFDITLNSVFCLEPPGDTLSRSHFFVAVLSGCIPVIFDGGHDLYEVGEQTPWPWRQTEETWFWRASNHHFLDYKEFAVVYTWEDVRNKDIFHELLNMSLEDRLKLRQGLEKVAPFMRYSMENNIDTADVLDEFHAVVEKIVDAHSML